MDQYHQLLDQIKPYENAQIEERADESYEGEEQEKKERKEEGGEQEGEKKEKTPGTKKKACKEQKNYIFYLKMKLRL